MDVPTERGRVRVERLLAELAERACAESHGVVRPELLEGYLPALLRAADRGRRLAGPELRRCRELGARAAGEGVGLPTIVDAYLSATRLVWADLVGLLSALGARQARGRDLTAVGQVVLRAADDALAAVAEGYVAAGRSLIRDEEAARREFVDDLLGGDAAVRDLVGRAERYGLRLTAPHVVAVIRAGRAFRDAAVAVASVEELLRARWPNRAALVATKDGQLVCVVATSADEPELVEPVWVRELGARAAREVDSSTDEWRAAVGGVWAGPTGIATSYREAREALDLADRVGWPDPVIPVRRIAVYRVLLRDVDAITDLVDAVLGPLRTARGGAQPLLDTVSTFLAMGAVATATARRMHLSVRAVTYRLARVHALTGYDPTDPADWLDLHVATTGAKLLGWPSD